MFQFLHTIKHETGWIGTKLCISMLIIIWKEIQVAWSYFWDNISLTYSNFPEVWVFITIFRFIFPLVEIELDFAILTESQFFWIIRCMVIIPDVMPNKKIQIVHFGVYFKNKVNLNFSNYLLQFNQSHFLYISNRNLSFPGTTRTWNTLYTQEMFSS